MTKIEAEQFRERWRQVEERLAEEHRHTSMETRYQQVAALVASPHALGWRTQQPEEVERVRQLWCRLKVVHRE